MNDLKLTRLACHNILINCADLSKSDSLLIISEDENLGWYKNDVSEAVFNYAKTFGLKVDILNTGKPKNNSRDKIIELANNLSLIHI